MGIKRVGSGQGHYELQGPALQTSFAADVQPRGRAHDADSTPLDIPSARGSGYTDSWYLATLQESNMKIRDAGKDDMEGITAIYNDAVEHTTAIWNDAKVDVANRLAWLADRQRAGYPVLVAVGEEDEVLGYASFGDWRAWDGYRHTVEHSVYVRADRRGSGIGASLMLALIERARNIGKHVMVAGIEAKNAGSIRLHEKLGFERVGYLKEVGMKFGSWLDLAFLQLTLDARSTPDR
jgi:phosphinothricin acetyltransferase